MMMTRLLATSLIPPVTGVDRVAAPASSSTLLRSALPCIDYEYGA